MATQCSCLENPRDGGVWWAAVYGVAQSQTRLKRLSSSSSPIPPTPQFHFLETIIFNPLVIFSALYLHVPSHSVVSDTLWPMDCSPPGSSVHETVQVKNTRVGKHSHLQRIFPTQGSNLCLLHCRQIFLWSETLAEPYELFCTNFCVDICFQVF